MPPTSTHCSIKRAKRPIKLWVHLTPGAFHRGVFQMVTWDEAKRRSNLKHHGLDFVGCERVFDAPVMTRDDDRLAYGEHRINLIGILDGYVVHLTYTERETGLHAISLRKATKHEARNYFSQIES